MKILLIAHSDSIHTARWVAQLADTGWDVRVFPCRDHGVVHSGLHSVTVYHRLDGRTGGLDKKLRLQQNWLFRRIRKFSGIRLPSLLQPRRRLQQLIRVLEDFRPDIVHSMEFQVAGYLTADARELLSDDFPPWIATNWGSDIYWYRQYPEHEQRIRQVLAGCSYYSCENHRDARLARELGFLGEVLPIFPFAGGFGLDTLRALKQPGPTAQRRVVLLKGYQHKVGRALVGLRALEACADLLRDYEIVVYSASRPTKRAIEDLRRRSVLKVKILPTGTPHLEMLRQCGTARISLGISLSDGVPASFLEALVMGAFPIQSWSAAADEWIDDGLSGLLVPPEDVDATVRALQRALTDDELVNRAANINERTALERLDREQLRSLTIECYRIVARQEGIPCS